MNKIKTRNVFAIHAWNKKELENTATNPGILKTVNVER